MKTIMAWIDAVLFFALLASGASAFPLSGGNGQVNATVFGTFLTNEGDSYTRGFTLVDLISTAPLVKVVLVDSEDKFYEPMMGVDSVGAYASWRHIWAFDLPEKVDIKRVRIDPKLGDPFSIDWKDVPEVSSGSMTMRFYGLSSSPGLGGGYGKDELNNWNVDVKITNNENGTITIDDGEFLVVDQFGFSYESSGTESVKLLSGESMRLPIKFELVSKLSRPVSLVYRPENLTMDISAWA
jgi:hypothetical protein